ncbi:MAG: lasso peptide biosynthesis B2 protein, partial [Proteobacteria bacterium]
ARTRRAVERLSRHRAPHAASSAELTEAKNLARLANIAGRRGPVEATCLRQSLLVFGWLRRSGLDPILQLGLRDQDGPFQAHAWVELEGTRLLPVDAGHRPFVTRLPNPRET